MRIDRLAAIAASALVAGAAAAHHGWAGYDQEQLLEIRAPLREVRWTNPHATAKVAFRGATWQVVLAPIARMEARGLAEEMIARGQTVTLVGYPRRDGTREIRIERLTVGGRTVELR